MKQKSVRLYSEKHLENIGSNFKNLFEDEVLTDLTLYCKEGSIKVHKLVLAASSSYFRQVFTKHCDKPAVFYMYGVSLLQLRNLVELMYKGSISLPTDNFNSVYGLAEELQIAGLLVDGLNERPTTTPAPCATSKEYNRDTRFKGQKRVNVDFNGIPVIQNVTTLTNERETVAATSVHPVIKQEKPDEPTKVLAPTLEGSQINQPEFYDDRAAGFKDESSSSKSTDLSMDESADEKPGLSSWEKAERKYQCDVCNSSFKRASHLSRHQLVHTGERPFTCDQCNKAFSRLDKLKHHMQKAHESESMDPLPADALYTIGHVQIVNPNELYQSEDYSYNCYAKDLKDFKEEPFDGEIRKKRGRPRKYPLDLNYVQMPKIPKVPKVPKGPKGPRGRPRIKPIVPKGPRGRPRIKPIVPPSAKRPRGRPRINPIGPNQMPIQVKKEKLDVYGTSQQQQQPPAPVGNYEPSNRPDSDLSYMKLYKADDHPMDILDLDDEPEFIEPFVEIQVDPEIEPQVTAAEASQAKPNENDPQQSFMHNIGLLETTVGKIGECTISVAPNSN